LELKIHSLGKIKYFKDVFNLNLGKLKLYEFHSDYVTEVPKGLKCLAESNSCNNEMFVSDDHRILTFQFHPEYTLEYIRALEGRWEREDSSYKGMHRDNYVYD
jgi:GMP synthase-like glutamine amidotransferase